MLCRLGFVLAGCTQIRHKRHMDIECIFAPDLMSQLPDRFEERLALDIAGRAADLRDDHIRIAAFADAVNEMLDLVGDMRDDLHGASEVFAAALLVQHICIDLAGREIGKTVQILVDEALIMSEVEVGFRAVLGHIDLAVLIGAHRAGIDVDVGIELLCGDLQAAGFEQPSERCRRDALAEPRNHAAGHKNILCHCAPPFNLLHTSADTDCRCPASRS